MIKKFLSEFKKFSMRGNVMDMAVGIIIGAAFGKIVDSLVKDVIMPPLGMLLRKINFADWFFVLRDGSKVAGPYESLTAATNAGAVTLNLGNFISTIISFIIVALAVFLLIKTMNTIQEKLEKKEAKEKADAPATTKVCPYCCSEIAIDATRCPHCTSELKKK